MSKGGSRRLLMLAGHKQRTLLPGAASASWGADLEASPPAAARASACTEHGWRCMAASREACRGKERGCK